MRKICVFTGTRAEYGLLKPLLDKISHDSDLHLQLLVSGAHLSPEFGLTYQIIEEEGFVIDEKVEMITSSDSKIGICKSAGLGLIGFGEALSRLQPDVLVILGDRYEALSIATAAMICNIPIAHIHGGESSFGAIDEAIRHSITKMSHLHFTSTDTYRKRVIQLGEHPDRVFNVGALGVENIQTIKLLGRKELEESIDFPLGDLCILVTFHPTTLENQTASEQVDNLLKALAKIEGLRVIFTKSNADSDGRVINFLIDAYHALHPDETRVFSSMGQLRYLSAMKHIQAVVGNSSSGIIEAPSFHLPTINIGDRQKGRVMAESIINCQPETGEILAALHKGLSAEFRNEQCKTDNPYEKKGTAAAIVTVLKECSLEHILKKEFFNL